MSNNYSQDISYTKQSDIQEYIDAFDIDNESIDFTTLENYSNSDYVFNTNALQKVKNNIDVMQSNFNNDIISDLDDKQELFQSWVNNLSVNAKPWQSGVENKYYKGDIVTYSEDPGAYFICLEDCDGTEPINYVKFTNTYNNIDKFDWGVCVNGDIDDENTLFIEHPEIGTLNILRLRYRYDGNYTLRFVKKDDFVGEIDYLIFKGSKEIFEHMNYVVDDSKWLRIYLKGDVGLNSFNLTYKGEWNNTVDVIDSLPSTIKLLDESIGTQNNHFNYDIVVSNEPLSQIFAYTEFKFNIPKSTHRTLSNIQYGFSCDYYFDYDGLNYINVYNIINSGTPSTQKMHLVSITKGGSTAEAISYQYVYVPDDVVYIKNGTNIDFYVCISEVAYNDNAIRPEQDSEHWVKLFTKKLDDFVVLDSMPNQAWFNDDTNPSVFGVQQNVYYYSASGERYDSTTMRAKNNSVSFVTQPPDEIKKVVVRCEFYRNNELYYSKNYTIDNLRILYPPSVITGIGFQIDDDKKNEMHVGFMCNYDYDQHRITLEVNNVQTAYSEIYTYSFCAYIKSIYAGEPLLKIVDRIHSESASNPQYLKLYTVANNVVDNNDNNLNTLINNLISNTNI